MSKKVKFVTCNPGLPYTYNQRLVVYVLYTIVHHARTSYSVHNCTFMLKSLRSERSVIATNKTVGSVLWSSHATFEGWGGGGGVGDITSAVSFPSVDR